MMRRIFFILETGKTQVNDVKVTNGNENAECDPDRKIAIQSSAYYKLTYIETIQN